MKPIYFIFSFLVFLCFCHAQLNGQTKVPEIQNTKISILTCRSGDELYSTFGHTAIRIFNSKSNLDRIFNYGVFSFNTPNFYPKFMRGKLPYYLGETKTEYFLREYNYEKRSVIEHELNLNASQKKEIIAFLLENAKPENREYKYDFFFDNCATRVVDVYNLIGDIKYSNVIEQKTYRQLLKENLQSLVWSEFGIDLVIGARADVIADRRGQMFLPEYVKKNLESAFIGDSIPLAKQPHLVLDYEDLNLKRKEKSINWPLWCAVFLLLLTLAINVLNLKYAIIYNKTILIISGIVGLLLLFMWFGTDHKATRDNWNLMWLNPIWLVYFLLKGKVKVIFYYVILSLLIIAGINCLWTILPQFFNMAFLPIIMTLAFILFRESHWHKTKVKTA